MQAMESSYDVCIEDLFNQTVKLEGMEKKAGNAESEVSSLRSRLILLQENNEKQEDRLAKATLELAYSCKNADQAVRKRIELLQMRSPLIILTNSLVMQNSLSVNLRISMKILQESYQLLKLMHKEEMKEQKEQRRRLLILRKNSELLGKTSSS